MVKVVKAVKGIPEILPRGVNRNRRQNYSYTVTIRDQGVIYQHAFSTAAPAKELASFLYKNKKNLAKCARKMIALKKQRVAETAAKRVVKKAKTKASKKKAPKAKTTISRVVPPPRESTKDWVLRHIKTMGWVTPPIERIDQRGWRKMKKMIQQGREGYMAA